MGEVTISHGMGYGGSYGFLHIRCGHCGDEKTFYTKNTIEVYFCDVCRKRTFLPEKMMRVSMQCECGFRRRYYTNITDKTFDMHCFECEQPVDFEKRKQKYTGETIYIPMRDEKPKHTRKKR